jgi:hypothetical protein
MRNHSAVLQIACSPCCCPAQKVDAGEILLPERGGAPAFSGCVRQPWGKRRREDTGGVHLMEMHANLRRVEDGQLKADE